MVRRVYEVSWFEPYARAFRRPTAREASALHWERQRILAQPDQQRQLPQGASAHPGVPYCPKSR